MWRPQSSEFSIQVVVSQKVRSTGFEPVTFRLEGGCSIQLSYERLTVGVLNACDGGVKIQMEKHVHLFKTGKIKGSGRSNFSIMWRYAQRGLRRII